MKKIISIVNQKGGTGKTTSTINLGSALSLNGRAVLIIDMDPQANLSYSMEINRLSGTIQDVLTSELQIPDAIINKELLDIIPSRAGSLGPKNSTSHEIHLLDDKIKELSNYDYVLIDCPPSLSVMTMNALLASDYILIPMQLDVFSIQGLTQITQTIKEINSEYQKDIRIIGVLPVLVDVRRKLTMEVLNYVREQFNLYVFQSKIRTNVKAAEAPSFGKSVIEYAPESNSAKDYMAAAKELENLILKI